MKIVSSRSRDEQWEDENLKRSNEIRSIVEQYLSEFKLDLRVEVLPQFNLDGYEVRIYCNYNKTSENAALSWEYSIQLDENDNVKLSSGSWSGLQAVVPGQLFDLTESVRCMEFIMNMDWKGILSVRTPKFSDFDDE